MIYSKVFDLIESKDFSENKISLKQIKRVVLRRIIKVLPMPDSVIKIINDWGKSQKNADFKDKLEFWDRLKQKYSWENDDFRFGRW